MKLLNENSFCCDLFQVSVKSRFKAWNTTAQTSVPDSLVIDANPPPYCRTVALLFVSHDVTFCHICISGRCVTERAAANVATSW